MFFFQRLFSECTRTITKYLFIQKLKIIASNKILSFVKDNISRKELTIEEIPKNRYLQSAFIIVSFNLFLKFD